MFYIGLMSGTSMDAVDIAIVDFDKKATLKHYSQLPISVEIKRKIRSINSKTPIQEVAETDYLLGKLFANSINKTLEHAGISATEIIAIGSHGQTIFHHPQNWKNSIQIGDANIICRETGITTVADFRRMDMAFNGEGAPLAPAFHRYQFQDEKQYRAILNIGGIANISILSNDKTADVIGFDIGPGNGLLDDWNFLHHQTEMDKNGIWALQGNINQDLFRAFTQDPYFALPYPKSTGRDYFNLDWLKQCLDNFPNVPPEDVQATLLELSMSSIASSVANFKDCQSLLVCGGGAKNPAMMNKLKELLPNIEVDTTERLGIHPDAVEAVTFAWLAYCRINNIALNLSGITGSEKPLLAGAIYSTT